MESELKKLVKEATYKILRNINESKKSTIKIAKNKRGTFTREASKHNKTPKQFAKEVLSSPDKYSSKMVKKANFCNNFGK